MTSLTLNPQAELAFPFLGANERPPKPRTRGVTEIYLHPAVATGQPITQSMSAYRHADELAALLDPEVLAARDAAQASYGGFTDLRRLTGKDDIVTSN